MYGCSKDWFSFHLGCHRSGCFTLIVKCFSFDSDSCPDVGFGLLLQFPHTPRAGLILLTFLFCPYFLLCSSIYSLPLVRYSCLLSWCSTCTFGFWRCISTVSMERDVLHIHILLHHFVLFLVFLKSTHLYTNSSIWLFCLPVYQLYQWVTPFLIGDKFLYDECDTLNDFYYNLSMLITQTISVIVRDKKDLKCFLYS